ncbi:unnamed protein product [Caenorhabditis brenneri]
MSPILPKLTLEDLVVDYSRKRKLSNTSPTSCSSSSSGTSSSTSCSDSAAPNKKNRPATPEDFLLKKRTMPVNFCPKQRTPTSQYHPKIAKESQAPRIPTVPRPLQHIPKPPPRNPSSNSNMQEYKEFRMLERQKAQAAKLNEGLDEPPMKKRAQRKRRELRQTISIIFINFLPFRNLL